MSTTINTRRLQKEQRQQQEQLQNRQNSIQTYQHKRIMKNPVDGLYYYYYPLSNNGHLFTRKDEIKDKKRLDLLDMESRFPEYKRSPYYSCYNQSHDSTDGGGCDYRSSSLLSTSTSKSTSLFPSSLGLSSIRESLYQSKAYEKEFDPIVPRLTRLQLQLQNRQLNRDRNRLYDKY